jgi:Domain of unknown function (DUF5060)
MSLSYRRLFSLASALVAAAGVWQSDHSITHASSTTTRINPITASTNSSIAPRYQVVEVNIGHDSRVYSNVWEGPKVNVTFVSPSGRSFVVGAFYHSANLWKARFAPAETGNWNWTLSWTDSEGTQTGHGVFSCVDSAERGWVRRHPTNPYRMVYEDGTLFSAIGIGDCVNDWNSSGSPFDDVRSRWWSKAHPYGWGHDNQSRELSYGLSAGRFQSLPVERRQLFVQALERHQSVWK